MAKPSGRKTSQFSLPRAQPQPSVPSLQNTFVGGLKTEFTGLNFPENACTSTSNCIFTRIGNVTRRPGFDFESNFSSALVTDKTNSAISTFLWENAGGDGNSVIYVTQVGSTLNFYLVSNATLTNSMSKTRLSSTVLLDSFSSTGGSTKGSECQYASGNGYLFVFNPSCEPFYCTYANGLVNAVQINIQVRDFAGVPDNLPDNSRPLVVSQEHLYNLQNQGWNSAPAWQGTSTSNVTLGTPTWTQVFNTQPSIPGVSLGQAVVITGFIIYPAPEGPSTVTVNYTLQGTVIAYVAGAMTIHISSASPVPGTGAYSGSAVISESWWITSTTGFGQISAWVTAIGNYPSNSDIWWTFKDTSNVFNPAVTINNVTVGGLAPNGSIILNAFKQLRSSVSGVTGITDVTTTSRPKTGCWYQGRVWYSGVDGSFTASGDQPYSTWTENIYFSQVIQKVDQFGKCYQLNDLTDEVLNALLPTDGGVIQIQGSGSIYKLFPVFNGLLVFAANGIWFITGGQSLGFTANDYTISKLSGEHSLSGTSFVSVLGFPMFWNADGIYAVMPGQSVTSGQKSLEVKNLTLPSIKQFYNTIPLSSKKFARGSYNHITGEVQWVYKSTQASSTPNASNWVYDSVLNFLTYTEAFYPWSLPSTTPNTLSVHDVVYIEGPGGSNVPTPTFKYLCSNTPFGSSNSSFTFADTLSGLFTDWTVAGNSTDYTSSFTTGYRLKGQAQRKFQPQYTYVYSEVPTSAYTWQGIWDYAATNLSNRYSGVQVVNNNTPLFFKGIRKLRTRGNGYVLQQKVGSVTGQPFNISGWSILDTIGVS